MGIIKKQSGTGRYGRIAQTIRTRAALCLACVYLLLSVFATLHPHGIEATDSGMAAAACVSHTAPLADAAAGESSGVSNREAAPLPILSAQACPVCDLLAQSVTTDSATPALLVPIAQIPIPALSARAVPYKPFRFCDRSASRAPPAASSLLA